MSLETLHPSSPLKFRTKDGAAENVGSAHPICSHRMSPAKGQPCAKHRAREANQGSLASVGTPHDTRPPFQVSVTARDDVPFFGPPLPDPAVFRKVRGSPQPRCGQSRTKWGGLGVHSALYQAVEPHGCQDRQAPLTDWLGPSFSAHLDKNCDCFTESQSRLYHCFTFRIADSVAFPPLCCIFDNFSLLQCLGGAHVSHLSEGALAPVSQQIPQTEAVGDPQPSSPEGWAALKGMEGSHRRLGWGTEPREVPFRESGGQNPAEPQPLTRWVSAPGFLCPPGLPPFSSPRWGPPGA